jgi:hypothetical protein
MEVPLPHARRRKDQGSRECGKFIIRNGLCFLAPATLPPSARYAVGKLAVARTVPSLPTSRAPVREPALAGTGPPQEP